MAERNLFDARLDLWNSLTAKFKERTLCRF
jgi:hypothetical protein